MYVLFSIAIIILLAAALIFRFRRKRIICRILGLSVPEKVYRLNCLLAPFGFEYQISQDIFVTRLDAWQREYAHSMTALRRCLAWSLTVNRFTLTIRARPGCWNSGKVSMASIPAPRLASTGRTHSFLPPSVRILFFTQCPTKNCPYLSWNW
mgnify:CR=1 FL=1